MAERTAISTASKSKPPVFCRCQKIRSSSCATSRLISSRSVSAVFFYRHDFLSRDGAQAADLLVDLDQLLRQALKAAKFSNFPFSFAYGTERREGLSNRFAGDFLGESAMGTVSRIIRLSAMAIELATASVDGGDRAGLKIAEL